jgi:SAM-dependent MidA family methyltransferase
MNQVGATRFQGALLVADYGLDDEEYDSVERSDGTVRRYRAIRWMAMCYETWENATSPPMCASVLCGSAQW